MLNSKQYSTDGFTWKVQLKHIIINNSNKKKEDSTVHTKWAIATKTNGYQKKQKKKDNKGVLVKTANENLYDVKREQPTG